MNYADTNTAEFEIQIQIVYKEGWKWLKLKKIFLSTVNFIL
jgi:hypothetical protein